MPFMPLDSFQYFTLFLRVKWTCTYDFTRLAQLRAQAVAKKREQVEQAVRESEQEAARKLREDEALQANGNNIPKGANVDGNFRLPWIEY